MVFRITTKNGPGKFNRVKPSVSHTLVLFISWTKLLKHPNNDYDNISGSVHSLVHESRKVSEKKQTIMMVVCVCVCVHEYMGL